MQQIDTVVCHFSRCMQHNTVLFMLQQQQHICETAAEKIPQVKFGEFGDRKSMARRKGVWCVCVCVSHVIAYGCARVIVTLGPVFFQLTSHRNNSHNKQQTEHNNDQIDNDKQKSYEHKNGFGLLCYIWRWQSNCLPMTYICGLDNGSGACTPTGDCTQRTYNSN